MKPRIKLKQIVHSITYYSQNLLYTDPTSHCHGQFQCAKKVVSDGLGLVDFADGLVISVLNLPNGQVLFLGKTQITEGL